MIAQLLFEHQLTLQQKADELYTSQKKKKRDLQKKVGQTSVRSTPKVTYIGAVRMLADNKSQSYSLPVDFA